MRSILFVFAVFCIICASKAASVPTNDTELYPGMSVSHTVKANTWNYYFYINKVSKSDWKARFAVAGNKKVAGVYMNKATKPTNICPAEKDMYHAGACGYLTKDTEGIQDVALSIGYTGPYKYGANSVYSPTGTYYIGVQGKADEDASYTVTFSSIGRAGLSLVLTLVAVIVSVIVAI